MPVGILAIGGYVPEIVIDNATIAAWANTTPEWIIERTGICTRRYAAADVPTSALAIAAVRNLLDTRPDALDGLSVIILATSTPDQPQPATAVTVQAELGLPGVPAFDLQAVCCGFVFALVVGAALIEAGTADRVLVIAADKYSSIMNRQDRRTVSLFGDGAGAVVIGHVPEGYGLTEQQKDQP